MPLRRNNTTANDYNNGVIGLSKPKTVIYTDGLFGRRDIYASFDDINRDNVVAEVNRALAIHCENLLEEEYLYWHRRGLTPVLNRTKERNSFVLNKIVVQLDETIVSFKNGFFLMTPAAYIARNESSQESVSKLNEYLYRSGKQLADNKVADWFHTVGKGALFVEPGDDDDVPYRAYALDPRSAFVVYSMSPGNKPVMGVHTVTVGDTLWIDVYTERYVFRLSGSVTGKIMSADPNYMATAVDIVSVLPNVIGKIPIIEYAYNSVKQSAFEGALALIDAASELQSARLDGVDQFIQSLVVMYNAELPEGEDADSLKKKGMILLKSSGENKADIKILSEQLNQSESQTLLDSLYDEIADVCAIPKVGDRSTYDTTGMAIMAANGWYQASVSAQNTTDLFKESNRYFDEIVLEILNRKGLITDLKISDFEINISRTETANMQSKAQAFNTLLASGLHPELAAAKSGVSSDPVSDIKMSEKYIKMVWGDPDKVDKTEEQTNGQGEAEIIEEARDGDTDETGGAV